MDEDKAKKIEDKKITVEQKDPDTIRITIERNRIDDIKTRNSQRYYQQNFPQDDNDDEEEGIKITDNQDGNIPTVSFKSEYPVNQNINSQRENSNIKEKVNQNKTKLVGRFAGTVANAIIPGSKEIVNKVTNDVVQTVSELKNPDSDDEVSASEPEKKKNDNSIEKMLILIGSVALMVFLFVIFGKLEPIAVHVTGEDEELSMLGTYMTYIKEVSEKWKAEGIVIDEALVSSVLFYEKGYYSNDYYYLDCALDGSGNCLEDDSVNSQVIARQAEQLADGMVKTVIQYFCQERIVRTWTTCEYVSSNPNDPCIEVEHTEVSYGEEKFCGEDDETLCNQTCSPGYQLSSKEIYRLKSTDEYIQFLKEDYKIGEKLQDAGWNIPNDPTLRDEAINEAISEIYDMYYVIKNFQATTNPISGEFPSLTYSSGSFNGLIYTWNQCGGDLANVAIPFTGGRSYCAGGCGLVASATIVSSLLGREISPVTIGSSFCTANLCTSGGTYGFEIAKQAASAYGFQYSAQFSSSDETMMQEAVDKLARGNSLVMVRVGAGTIANGLHFIVITGVNADGTVTIVDSGRPSNNNRTWTLEEIGKNAMPGGFMIVSR